MDIAKVDESPRQRRPWWKNIFVIYDIVINVLLIGFIVATFLYIRHYKIPIVSDHKRMIVFSVVVYCLTTIAGTAIWLYIFIKKMPERPFEGQVMGQCPIWGVITLILFLYSISPIVALIFGIPSLLWFIPYLCYGLRR